MGVGDYLGSSQFAQPQQEFLQPGQFTAPAPESKPGWWGRVSNFLADPGTARTLMAIGSALSPPESWAARMNEQVAPIAAGQKMAQAKATGFDKPQESQLAQTQTMPSGEASDIVHPEVSGWKKTVTPDGTTTTQLTSPPWADRAAYQAYLDQKTAGQVGGQASAYLGRPTNAPSTFSQSAWGLTPQEVVSVESMRNADREAKMRESMLPSEIALREAQTANIRAGLPAAALQTEAARRTMPSAETGLTPLQTQEVNLRNMQLGLERDRVGIATRAQALSERGFTSEDAIRKAQAEKLMSEGKAFDDMQSAISLMDGLGITFDIGDGRKVPASVMARLGLLDNWMQTQTVMEKQVLAERAKALLEEQERVDKNARSALEAESKKIRPTTEGAWQSFEALNEMTGAGARGGGNGVRATPGKPAPFKSGLAATYRSADGIVHQGLKTPDGMWFYSTTNGKLYPLDKSR